MPKIDINAELIDLSDLRDDPENANLGTERGASALDLSISEFGFLEPGVIGGDGIVISGNKRKSSAARNGITKAMIIDLPDDTAVYVRKPDMNISDPADIRARRAAIALNRVGQLNLKWNPEVTKEMESKGVSFKGFFDQEEVPHFPEQPKKKRTASARQEGDDGSIDELESQYLIVIECGSEAEQSEILTDLIERGISAKALIS